MRPSHFNHPRWSSITNVVLVSPVVGFVRAVLADDTRNVDVIFYYIF